MDERTSSEKSYEAALRSERRTIGHRMSRKVLVIAPTNRQAQDWAAQHSIAYSDAVVVTPLNCYTAMLGFGTAIEHVILGWNAFHVDAQNFIRAQLLAMEAVPFEGLSDEELSRAAAVRD